MIQNLHLLNHPVSLGAQRRQVLCGMLCPLDNDNAVKSSSSKGGREVVLPLPDTPSEI